MSTARGQVLVQVEYNYQYTARDGRLVSIKQNEIYILLSRTNDHWWHVKKDNQSKPFYLPAHYVRELALERAVSPVIPTLVTPDDNHNQNIAEVSRTQSIFKKHWDVEKDQLLYQEKQGLRYNNSHPIVKEENQSNISPTEPKDSSLCLQVNDNSPTLLDLNSSQCSEVPPELTPCYSEVTRAFEKNKKYNPKRLTSPGAPRQSSTVRIRSKQQENYTHRLSLRMAHPAQLAVHPGDLGFNLGLNKVKDIGSSEKVSSVRCASFSHGVNYKRHSAVEIAGEILGHAKVVETKNSSLPRARPSDDDNVYESIPDLPKTKAKSRKELCHDISKIFNEKPEAVYQNVGQLKQEFTEEPPVASTDLTTQQEEWETHTDQSSGLHFYYNAVTRETTWDCPFTSPDSSEQPTPSSRSSSTSIPLDGWESLFDDVSGQPYYYNPATGETTWEPPGQAEAEVMEHGDALRDQRPPTPKEDYPELIEGSPPGHRRQPSNLSQEDHSEPQSPIDTAIYQSIDPKAPQGWFIEVDQEGQMLYTSEVTHTKWIRHTDASGKFYYYNLDEDKSEWELPQYEAPSNQHSAGNGMDQEGNLVFSHWRHGQSLKMIPLLHSDTEEKALFATHRRNASDFSAELALGQRVDILLPHSQSLDKAGILNKAKVADNGKRIRKNWTSSWTVLQGGILTFYKDPKNQSAGSLKQAIGQIIPEYTVELKGATVGWATKDKSSKKNVLELKTRGGSEYLIQYDIESLIGDWYKMINESILQTMDSVSTEEVDSAHDTASLERLNNKEKDEKRNRPAVSKNPVVSTETADTKKIKTKLKKFLQRRPTLQTVKDKGYIQDQVFGCELADLCRREGTTVPRFVLKCIQDVERRGLDIDGLYRVSGNLAVIQKLRFKIDHDENVNLNDGPWDDVHVITGALKLFFRELPEPLFPFNYFNNFIAAIKLGDPVQRLSYMKELINSLPEPNHDTMQVLFRHLCNVIGYRSQNRMTSQSMAIVFGPTLLKPEVETGNMAIHMVYQNQIVEFILNQFQHLFNENQELAGIR